MFRFFLNPQMDESSDEYIHLKFDDEYTIRCLLELMVIEYGNKTDDTQQVAEKKGHGREETPCEKIVGFCRNTKENGCDFVIALGGGSVMDCTKCIALMAANPGDIWDYSLSASGGKKNAQFPAIPIVCITTSAGTASEVDIASVITNDATQEKTGIFFPSMFPTLSIIDSDLMMSVPPKFTTEIFFCSRNWTTPFYKNIFLTELHFQHKETYY